MNQHLLIMYKDVYDTKKSMLQGEISGLESRVASLSEVSSIELVDQTSRRIEQAQQKVLDLWQSRMEYMKYLVNPNQTANEMALGRQTQHNLKERLQALSTTILNLEALVLDARQANSRTSESRSQPSSNKTYFDKLPLPSFSGKITEYPTFKSQFQALVKHSNYPEVLLLEHLKRSIPKDQHHLVEGSTDLTSAWTRLDQRFGDKITASVIIQNSLASLELKGKEFEKVERLQDEINKALRMLEPMGAKNLLTDDLKFPEDDTSHCFLCFLLFTIGLWICLVLLPLHCHCCHVLHPGAGSKSGYFILNRIQTHGLQVSCQL